MALKFSYEHDALLCERERVQRPLTGSIGIRRRRGRGRGGSTELRILLVWVVSGAENKE